jgi:hypothetical protein
MLSILEGEGRRPQEPDPTDPLDSLRMCDRILFLDDNYTNIDFAGLIATLLTLLVLCMISYIKEAKVAYKKFAPACKHRYEEARPALQEFSGSVRTFFLKISDPAVTQVRRLVTPLRNKLIKVGTFMLSLLPEPWTRNSWFARARPSFPFSPFWHGHNSRWFNSGVPAADPGLNPSDIGLNTL